MLRLLLESLNQISNNLKHIKDKHEIVKDLIAICNYFVYEIAYIFFYYEVSNK